VDASNLFALNNLAYSLAMADPDEAAKLARRAAELAPEKCRGAGHTGVDILPQSKLQHGSAVPQSGGCEGAIAQAGVSFGCLLPEERQQGVGSKTPAKGAALGFPVWRQRNRAGELPANLLRPLTIGSIEYPGREVYSLFD
jgi:hypothetical protein